jgi:4-hydroxybenzoate polyprenyltransferase
MGRWLTYQRERFPLATYLLLSVGMGAQATVIATETLTLSLVIPASLMPLLFFAVLRLMDEVKDVAKDRIAHPERPLARGLIPVEEARRTILLGLGLMVFLAVLLFNLFGPMPGLFYACTTLYLWLMYKEFYVGAWLSQRPLLYAATHQAILLPLVASSAALAPKMPLGVWDWSQLFLGGLQILPAFFAYEVARKLEPEIHPILGAYRSVYGLRRCQIILLGLALLSLFSMTVALAEAPFVWTNRFLIGALLSVSILSPVGLYLVRGDRGAKTVEALATLNLLVSMYAPVAVFAYLRFVGGVP